MGISNISGIISHQSNAYLNVYLFVLPFEVNVREPSDSVLPDDDSCDNSQDSGLSGLAAPFKFNMILLPIMPKLALIIDVHTTASSSSNTKRKIRLSSARPIKLH